MKSYYLFEKEVGETPLQALERFRAAYGIAKDVPLTYAGRLDPMAEGKLLILSGEECKRKVVYENLDKEYLFEVALDVRTDTGDVLGIAELGKMEMRPQRREVQRVVRALRGPHQFPYPVFSSKTVRGKQLFQYALEGKIHEVDIPLTKGRVYTLQCEGMRTITLGELARMAQHKIETLHVPVNAKYVGSDFRKNDVLTSWQAHVHGDRVITILTCRARVSAGTYIRTISEEIAKRLGTVGIALSIQRTVIGAYAPLFWGRGFWWARYM